MRQPNALLCGVLLALAGCTDASIYSVTGKGANLPDRATFEGTVCVPSASGRHFPTRILFAVQGGAGIDLTTRGSVVDALTRAVERYTSPFIRYGLVAYDDFAFSLVPGGLTDLAGFTAALPRYNTFAQPPPLSIARALELSESLISGSLIGDCPGARARGRYTVVLIMFDKDVTPETHCGNIGTNHVCFKAGANCGNCLLDYETRRIRKLMERYAAADVAVQPVYVELGSAQRKEVRDQADLIANLVGTKAIVTDISGLKTRLAGLNLSGLLAPMKIRTALAWNRNARARGGTLVPDSDGDGLPDEDELKLGTNLEEPDTDLDGLLDGIEVLGGLDPLTPDELKGCDLGMDEDRDGLNSCEERLVGTSDCMGDTDGDGMPDIVEAFGGTNPLVGEGTLDADRDGFGNLDELRRHTDATSNDLEFLGSHSYSYDWEAEAIPLPGSDEAAVDACPGRERYRVSMSNVGLVATKKTPQHDAGVNDLYLYTVFALDTGGSIARWQAQQVTFKPPSTRIPADPVILLDETVNESRP